MQDLEIPGLQRLEIEAPLQSSSSTVVLAPGASLQLIARGYFADGTSRDVTRQARWVLHLTRGNASVTGGLVQARRPGAETIQVSVGSDDTYVEAQRDVLIMADGTFALRGSVRAANSGQSISGATLAVVGNPDATTQTGSDGSYVLWSVPPVAEIAIAQPGYRHKVQRVTVSDHQARVDFALDEETPFARLAGTYSLTLSADPNCSIQGTAFPDELRVRRYTAVVTQIGNELTVTLSGATFHRNSWGRFTGQVSPGSATFTLIGGYWMTFLDGDVVEQPSPWSALIIDGRATVSTSALAGNMDGTFALQDLEDLSGTAIRSSCSSPNHQFRLSR